MAYGRKGKGVTLHSLVEGHALPLAAITTAANVSEAQQVEPLLDDVKLLQGRWGKPRKNPDALQADAAYDTRQTRTRLRSRHIRPLIVVNPRGRKHPKRGRRPAKPVDRWKGEQTFAWYQRKFRRLVVRWERNPVYWQGFVLLAICFMWLEKLVG